MSEFNKYSTDGGATFIDVEDTNGRIMSEQLIRDTVGWTRKNILKNTGTNTTIHGVAYTVNVDKSVTLNNQASADNSNFVINQFTIPAGVYILSKTGTNDAAFQVTDYPITRVLYTAKTDDVTMTFAQDTAICVRISQFANKTYNNLTIYPMIRLATIPDSTYERYHEPVGDMCTAGSHYTVGIYACLTPNNGKNPECFIPWNNPNRKTITFGDNVKILERTSNGWNELAQDSKPTVLYTSVNGFHIYFNLTTALQSNTPYTFKIQGDLVFS